MSAGEPRREGGPDPAVLEQALVQLVALQRESAEVGYVRRADALERIAETIRRLGELRGGHDLLARAAVEFGRNSQFSRVLISEVSGNQLQIVAAWERDHPADTLFERLDAQPVALRYPLREHELARTRETQIVSVGATGTAGAWSAQLARSAYVVAPLVAELDTIGFVHADDGDRVLDELDRDIARRFATGLSGVLERAVLRHTLELHSAELAAAAQWIAGAASRLSDVAGRSASAAMAASESRALRSLTTREFEILQLLADGLTNRQIAHQLVVREGTVKYHVKNVFRKLGASSRADAAARYLRTAAAGLG